MGGEAVFLLEAGEGGEDGFSGGGAGGVVGCLGPGGALLGCGRRPRSRITRTPAAAANSAVKITVSRGISNCKSMTSAWRISS